MTSMIRFLTLAGLVVGGLSITALAQTSMVIPNSEAPQHIRENATVEGAVTACPQASEATHSSISERFTLPELHRLDPAGTPLASDRQYICFKAKSSKNRRLV
jgi:hypothetical protein